MFKKNCLATNAFWRSNAAKNKKRSRGCVENVWHLGPVSKLSHFWLTQPKLKFMRKVAQNYSNYYSPHENGKVRLHKTHSFYHWHKWALENFTETFIKLLCFHRFETPWAKFELLGCRRYQYQTSFNRIFLLQLATLGFIQRLVEIIDLGLEQRTN